MLANLVDIDEAMVLNACSSEEGAAMFFDFAAAFPSICHAWIFAVLHARQFPAVIINFVMSLYNFNSAYAWIEGQLHFLFFSGGLYFKALISWTFTEILRRRYWFIFLPVF